jgi:uncharacterized small protein (DUF1192 family)
MFDQREHFAKADQQVSELKQRIARQRNVIERTKETRHSTGSRSGSGWKMKAA